MNSLTTFSGVKYIESDNICQWERYNHDKLNFLFKKFIYYANKEKICDQTSYSDFVKLIFNNSNKMMVINQYEDSSEED